MAKYIINGGKRLEGRIKAQGAKNAVLPLFAGAILTGERVTIGNCPDIKDVESMLKILSSLGVTYKRMGKTVVLEAADPKSYEIERALAGELRSSIFLLGAILGRLHKAKVAYPGGCDIGLRPIDIHLKALADMNVKIVEGRGYIYCDASDVKPAFVTLDYPSVGATENIMLLASCTEGVTTIGNSAREPEVTDLQNFLNSMGAEISGAGTPFIRIKGKSSLHGTVYDTIPDRIAVGTYMIATAVCGGRTEIECAVPEHLHALIAKLKKCGCKIVCDNGIILTERDGALKSLGCIDTQPYPGFPTDLQAPICALACVAKGSAIITENVFETRFKHIPELQRMGAKVRVKDRVAVIDGVDTLYGAEVTAMDLRGGASLVVAGIGADGVTVVDGIRHIQRGYSDLIDNFRALGADIFKE